MKLSNQNKIVVGVIALILALTVGYAIFSETLNIGGTASASGEFSLIFSDKGEIKEVGSHGATADIIDNKKKLDIKIPALEYPSAYVEIPATIKNEGTIDAILTGIEVSNLSNEDITVSYSGVKKDEIIKAGKEKEIKITVTWNEDSKNTSPNLEFNIKLVYYQVTSENGGGTAGGKENYELGDEFCLGDECFYTISDNGDTVTALSKYNLLVGNVTKVIMEDGEINGLESITPISSDTIGYGRQSKDALGAVMTNTTWTGTVAFADSDCDEGSYGCSYGYWTDETGNLLPKYGTSYPVDVYDSNSKLYKHVKDYENYLRNTLGKTSVSAKILTFNELVSLGCDAEENICSNAPVWVYDTTYWSASARDDYDVWGVVSNADFGGLSFDYGNFAGVRPVITILKSEI